MNTLIEDLNRFDPAIYKKLSWLRSNEQFAFYQDQQSAWLPAFIEALNQIPDVKVIGSGEDNRNEFHINIAYMTPRAHEEFIKHFYLEGIVKQLFKENMYHSSANLIAFQMATVRPSSWRDVTTAHTYQRHFLYEISPPGQKLHAATKEHKESLAFFQWMLFLDQTCSISAFYDVTQNVRHIQTIFKNYDQAVHERISQETKKYPSYYEKRDTYNQQNNIRQDRKQEPFTGNILQHHIFEGPFLNEMQLEKDRLPLNLL